MWKEVLVTLSEAEARENASVRTERPNPKVHEQNLLVYLLDIYVEYFALSFTKLMFKIYITDISPRIDPLITMNPNISSSVFVQLHSPKTTVNIYVVFIVRLNQRNLIALPAIKIFILKKNVGSIMRRSMLYRHVFIATRNLGIQSY